MRFRVDVQQRNGETYYFYVHDSSEEEAKKYAQVFIWSGSEEIVAVLPSPVHAAAQLHD